MQRWVSFKEQFVIKNLKMFEGEFHGARTAYSANGMFIVILTNPKVKYDHEVIGAAIFPEGFGAMDPPGPSSGFGAIVLTDDEDDGRVVIADLKVRENDDGKKLSKKAIKDSLKEYIDGFFVVDKVAKCIRQVKFAEFYKLFGDGTEYTLIHFCEFEPDE